MTHRTRGREDAHEELETIERHASRDGISLSLKVRDLVREALEIEEDIALTNLSEARERTLPKAKLLQHDAVW